MASDCTEQSILEFLMKSGGRVEHMELINHFELIWKNDSTQTKDRETLSRLVDAVALVTVENGVKFVCMKMDCLDAVRRTDANVYAVECNGNGVNTHDSSLSRTSAPTVDLNETSDDCFNGNSNDKDQTREKSPISPVLVDNNPKPHVSSSRVAISKEPASSTLGQVANDTTTTFAGTEVKMRERRRRESAPAIGSELDHPAHPVGHHCQVRGGRRISKGSQRAMLTSGLSEDSPWEGLDTLGDSSTPKGSRRNFIELMMSSSPQVRRSMIHRSSCLRDSVKGDGDTASLLSSSATDEDCCASVTLDPLEHEWMLCASDGQWDSLQPLLAVEPSLLSKRDFVTGFTCLHWAAKQGKVELLGQLLSFARDSAVPVDVNGRSGSGYTPMHLAAMHCHTQVVRTLVSDWEADTEVRDYSGKQAIQYLPPPLAADLHHQGVVAATSPTGAPPGTDAESTDRGGGTGRGWRLARALQSGNLNPLRLLNPSAEVTEPDAGASCKPKAGALQRKSSLGRLNARLHRGRRRAQIIHSPSFRESGEVRGDEPLCSPVRTRPMSSLFGLCGTMTTIVHDTAEAVCLCEEHNLYLKPTAKMTISVALPQLKLPGKSISNWEVMERLKAMVAPEQLSALRISKSTMDFIRFEGEVENKGIVKTLLSRLDGKSIKLSGFTDILKVRALENKMDFPTRHDWDSFFRDAKDMNETLPGERPDTIHLEGLPCRWFSLKDSQHPDRPSEEVLATIFQGFGKVRNVDIPMLDPYREEMTDKNFNTFSFGGHLYFEAYVQYQEYHGFTKAMDTLRGMKLMLKGDDGKAMACNIKITFDTSKHLSSTAVRQRSQERLKLQELERQREEQKRKEKEEEDRRKEDERKLKEQEEEERERRREERVRKREQKVRDREERRNLKRVKRRQDEEQRKLQLKIATEERRLLLAQRNLESIRLIAELLARAKAVKQQQQERERLEREELERQERVRQDEERARLQQLEARRRRQEDELRRVEAEKERALELQRRERDLRQKLLGNLLKKSSGVGAPAAPPAEGEPGAAEAEDAQDPTSLPGGGGGDNDIRVAQGNCLKGRKVRKPKKPAGSGVGSQGAAKKKGSSEKRKADGSERERRREEGTTGRGAGSGGERAQERRSSERDRRNGSRGRRRHSRSHSSSRRRRSSSRRRRSHSRRDTRRRSRGRSHRGRSSSSSSSSSRSSSRYRSRSSSGRSYGRSRRGHRRSRSRRRSGDSRSSSRGRERRSYSHDNRRRRRSRSRSRDSRSRHR